MIIGHYSVGLGLKRGLKKLERDINDEKRELQVWTDFRDYGQHQLATQIRLLKKELEDMNENYKIMSESIQNNLSHTLESIKVTTEEAIQRKNKSAAQVIIFILARYWFKFDLLVGRERSITWTRVL